MSQKNTPPPPPPTSPLILWKSISVKGGPLDSEFYLKLKESPFSLELQSKAPPPPPHPSLEFQDATCGMDVERFWNHPSLQGNHPKLIKESAKYMQIKDV